MRPLRYLLPWHNLIDPFSIGDAAKNAYHTNPSNTVFDAKRLIGRKLDDPDVKRDLKHWPFKVREKSGKPSVAVQYKGQEREFVSTLAHTHDFVAH